MSKRWVAIILVGIPAWLVGSTLFGWWAWNREHSRGIEGAKFAQEVDGELLAGDLKKVRAFATPRGVGDERQRLGLTRMAAMIEGTLGPSNAGYEVRRLQGVAAEGGEWPALQVVVRGDERPALWVICPYDELPGHEDPSGVVSTMAVAAAVAGKPLGRPVRFLFVPHRKDADLLKRMASWIPSSDVAIWITSASGHEVELVAGPRKDPGFQLIQPVGESTTELPEFVEFGIIPTGPPAGDDLVPVTRSLVGMISDLAR
ncbi:MAG: hypothetical protein MUF31_07690 [Akkermansiaceae bacterium]|jgi:hypothetical protein|nr:hypothetical protein [Akkermansiaceae bacterium]